MKKLSVKISNILLALAVIVSTVFSAGYSYAEKDGVESIIGNMTLTEKIQQTFVMDFQKWDINGDGAGEDMTYLNEEVARILASYHFGGVILSSGNLSTTEGAYNLVKGMQEAAVSGGNIPLLTEAKQEGGSVFQLGTGTALPGNLAIAATGNVENAKTAGTIIGEELSSLGINTAVAPVLNIISDKENTEMVLRSFGDDPKTAGEFGSAMIKAIEDENVAACAKYFPAAGVADEKSKTSFAVIDKSYRKLKKNEIKPFKEAIRNGVDMIMTANAVCTKIDSSTIHSEKTDKDEMRPASMSEKVITEKLKGKLGFEGVVCTAPMNDKAVTDTFEEGQAVVEALAAGADVIFMPASGIVNMSGMSRVDSIISKVIEAVESGYISEERIDDAVRRILTLKEKRGILDYSSESTSLDKALKTVGSAKHKFAERKIAAEAVTVVKNEDDILPYQVKEADRVLFLCPYKNERTPMVLGWNRAQKDGIIPETANLKVCSYSPQGKKEEKIKRLLEWADVVVISSEISSLSQMAYDDWSSSLPEEYVKYCDENGKISIILSNSLPCDIQMYDEADGVVAVYGNKGSDRNPERAIVYDTTMIFSEPVGPNISAGIEVILGNRSASGKLPQHIYKFDNSNDSFKNKKEYRRGYGKTYEAIKSISNFKISLEFSKAKYSGKEIEPKVTIEGLKQGKDYTVSYQDNINVGTAKVAVTGKGSYCGKCGTTFEITKVKPEIKAATEKYKVDYEKVKYKNAYIPPVEVTGIPEKTAVSYEKTDGPDNISFLSDGTVKIKRGTQKGEYKIKFVAKTAETENCLVSKSSEQTITIKVK